MNQSIEGQEPLTVTQEFVYAIPAGQGKLIAVQMVSEDPEAAAPASIDVLASGSPWKIMRKAVVTNLDGTANSEGGFRHVVDCFEVPPDLQWLHNDPPTLDGFGRRIWNVYFRTKEAIRVYHDVIRLSYAEGAPSP